jgi:two-component system KDP operon response regulator KdpE
MRILVVDDDPQVLKALTLGFQLQWQDSLIIPAADGETGLRAFFEHAPDVVVLDVALPGKNGFDVLEAIRRVSDVPVIMLTAHGEDLDQVRGLELGADDYVAKPFSHLALVARIRAVLRRAELPQPIQASPDVEIGDLAINFQHQRVTLGGEPIRLTPLEYKLLYQLVRNAGRILPHQALLDYVWGSDYGATTEHLKVFISRLRAKLDPDGSRRLIETERGIGYRFARQPVPPGGQPAGTARVTDGS